MTTYRVGMGETPGTIAARFGRHPIELVRANPHKQRMRDGQLVFLGLIPGEQINMPAHWGLGAPKIVAGGVLVDAQIALAACQGNWSQPSSWPVAMTTQAESLANTTSQGDITYVYYDGALYEFSSKGGGAVWITRVCSSPNKSIIPGVIVPTPQIPQVPVPTVPGPYKPVDYKPATPTTTTTSKSSSALPIAIAVAALASGIGLAYLVTRPKVGEEEMTPAAAERTRTRKFRRQMAARHRRD